MSKINIKPIEEGLESNDAVASSFDLNGKTMYLVATYHEKLADAIINGVKDSIGEPEITPDAKPIETK